MSTDSPLLEVDDLVVEFATLDGVVHAVDGVTFDVRPGEVVGIVGESGSGKSVTALTILGLTHRASTLRGAVRFDGRDLLTMGRKELRRLRGGELSMVFQDPMTSLNPVMTVGAQIAEAIRLHRSGLSAGVAVHRAVELLESVGVPSPAERARQYPHEFSGGMRQRAMIAMAIANRPRLLIADEPTTALDVTVQAQVLELIRDTARQTGASTILITHDLGVVAELADRVLVMYAGRVVESGDVGSIFAAPRHPYTAGLLASLPRLDGLDDLDDLDVEDLDELPSIPGSPPSLLAVPPGCPFHPRCALSRDRTECRTSRPALTDVDPGHRSACHFAEELAPTQEVVS